MSRDAARVSLTLKRGSTWEDDFLYLDENGDPYDLSTFNIRLQVRTEDGVEGTTTATTLLMEKNSVDNPAELFLGTHPDYGSTQCVVKTLIPADEIEDLNPDNEDYLTVYVGIELYKDVSGTEYVIPFLEGPAIIRSELVR